MENQKKQFNPASQRTGHEHHIPSFLSKSLESYTEFEEKWTEVLARFLTKSFGTLRFLNLALIFFFLWIIVNVGLFPWIKPFDPFPFTWLIMIVELFAIVLSIIVLINQNREARISEIRQQIDLEVNVRAEHEITKILHMIEEIHKELGIDKLDRELEHMKEMTDIAEIKEDIEQVIQEKNSNIDL